MTDQAEEPGVQVVVPWYVRALVAALTIAVMSPFYEVLWYGHDHASYRALVTLSALLCLAILVMYVLADEGPVRWYRQWRNRA